MRKLGALAMVAVLAATAVAGESTANKWVRVGDAEIGPRSNYGMVWSAKLKRFVLWGGGISLYPKRGPFPYDVQSAAPGSGEWRNEFPAGKDWGPKVGKCQPPVWAGYRFSTKDKDGNCRPHMRHAFAYSQYCAESDGQGMWAIIQNTTMRYDFEKKTWEDFGAKSGPGTGTGGTLKWGALCYDPVNKDLVQFGGAHGSAQLEGGTTWLFSTEKKSWRKLEASSKTLDPLRADVNKLRVAAKDLAAALRNRFYKTELAANAKVDLTERAAGLAKSVSELKGKVTKATGADAQEKKQLTWCAGDLSAAAAKLKAVSGTSAAAIKACGSVERTLIRARDALSTQPPPRLLAPMAYDSKAKKIVMFGGDRWDHLCADTWVYDVKTRKWSERRPAAGPKPRAGHALLHLPKSGKVLLVGGYTYRTSMSYCAGLYSALPAEVWAYDTGAGKWSALGGAVNGKGPRFNSGARAAVVAVSADDLVTAIQSGGYKRKAATWTFRAVPTSTGAALGGAAPGATVRRGECFDPEWYDAAPAADEKGIEAKLKGLPVNKWVSMNPPKVLQDRCWGTQIFDADRDQILHWTGGHSSHGGTDPAHYSIKTNRWNTGFAPEEPMEVLYSNTGTNANAPAAAFTGRPFLPHNYQSYCYDPASKKLIWASVNRAWVYDLETRDWDPKVRLTPFRAERHITGLCPTKHGVVVWSVALKGGHGSRSGLWILKDIEKNQWEELVKPVRGALLGVGCDGAGMTFDSKRDRLYLFNFRQKQKERICYYDFKEKKVDYLDAKGKIPASASMGREPVYMPEHDLVFLASRAGGRGSTPATMIYDPVKNEWLKFEPAFDKTKRGAAIRPAHGVTTGVMWDPKRKILWASNSRGQIFVMRFDRKSAKLQPSK
jgi:Galactose oxidase, central domain